MKYLWNSLRRSVDLTGIPGRKIMMDHNFLYVRNLLNYFSKYDILRTHKNGELVRVAIFRCKSEKSGLMGVQNFHNYLAIVTRLATCNAKFNVCCMFIQD